MMADMHHQNLVPYMHRIIFMMLQVDLGIQRQEQAVLMDLKPQHQLETITMLIILHTWDNNNSSSNNKVMNSNIMLCHHT